jgi:GNAT superfamily N-acetyltransferase
MPVRRAAVRPRSARTGAGTRRDRGPLHLRVATVRDLATLVRHRRKMWEELRDFSPAELDRHDVDYRRWVRREMARGKFLALVVDDGANRTVGSGGLWLMPSQPRPGPLGRGEWPYILSMYTEPGYRGHGIASRIVRRMIAWSRARGYRRLVLHASRFGRPVYERLGFEAGSEMRLELPQRRAGVRRRRPSRT